MKKYLGNAFKGKFEYNYNLKIDIEQLETALGITDKSIQKIIGSKCYNKSDNQFTTPALYVNTYNDIKQLKLKIEISGTKTGKIAVSLNEFVPTKQAEQKVETATVVEEESDDLPF